LHRAALTTTFGGAGVAFSAKAGRIQDRLSGVGKANRMSSHLRVRGNAEEPPGSVPPLGLSSAELDPVLPRGVTNVVALLLAVAAVASVAAISAGDLPHLATFRERAALDFVFATLLPMLMLWGAFRLYEDAPPTYEPSRGHKGINVAIGLPLLLVFGLTWAWCIISGLAILVSFIFGSPATGDWGP
jgi:hypothetical protein